MEQEEREYEMMKCVQHIPCARRSQQTGLQSTAMQVNVMLYDSHALIRVVFTLLLLSFYLPHQYSYYVKYFTVSFPTYLFLFQIFAATVHQMLKSLSSALESGSVSCKQFAH